MTAKMLGKALACKPAPEKRTGGLITDWQPRQILGHSLLGNLAPFD